MILQLKNRIVASVLVVHGDDLELGTLEGAAAILILQRVLLVSNVKLILIGSIWGDQTPDVLFLLKNLTVGVVVTSMIMHRALWLDLW